LQLTESEHKTAFQLHDWKGAAFIGILLGLNTFWNGALSITALLILGSAIIWSSRRGDLLLCCAIATAIALLELRFFVHGGRGFTPQPSFGFLAEYPTLRGVAVYYLKLLGLVVPLLAIAIWKLTPVGRWLLASILLPIVFATTFTLTPDISVNHKFVNASVRIAAIFVALVLVTLAKSGRVARFTAVLLFILLIPTGVVDFITLWEWNNEKRTHDLADPMIDWARRETDPAAVFAAPPVWHHLVYYTGRRSYLGNPGWANSAGYYVAPWVAALTRIYESGDAAEVSRIARVDGISYVIVDGIARQTFPHMREDAFKNHFRLVFSHGSTQVYALQP